ncbi:Mo-dependent nitrogenase C-terminal domain-containing protein [Limnothrix sp. FACHB-881]|uniref:Mo-dependent nitrogenase C-terminal domain-containing protein n=1 Tax=unclassified Limnothrix TaxID=2632864 RepID=UPI001683AEA5|nr:MULTISPECIES: Mo-dependent nitrogenase C-terminal domain-containing protein [unclassified Limnothrix]MBD2553286.1 Mo-dependent nitrogenase C-terminal domain-containing protein [Limnothrix sp. FACHB-708]MBD2590690.1 Mo-dependent nitrogenase C-terminal domain-containing protein [Limnothrix sp. FACHB-406]MBD2635311.1 Mo-dependent nitrogenase C-terminal domain-containing protein [Limnothrix sp. FACHB-881]
MFQLLQFLRDSIDRIEIRDREMALLIYRLIPSQCPFARDVKLFGRLLFRIPPLCKLNPLYEQLMGLRFRATCYLVDQCGIDLLALG